MPIRKSGISGGGIPFGTSANRPANPEFGQPYFNADAARLEMYTTATGWQNIIQETPSVVNVSGIYAEGNPSNVITINGTNFAEGAIAYAVGTNGTEIAADLTNVVSIVQIDATFSELNKAYEPFDIKVVNPSNLYGILYDTLQVDDIPVWITQSGSLGTYVEDSPMSIQTSATDEESSNLIFSILSGSLPPGLSLNSATGEISGTPQTLVSNATYSFVLSVTDGNNSATRNFSITINDRGPVWQTAQTLSSFSKSVAYSETIVATDDDGILSYMILSGSLPTNVSLNSSTGEIFGTPTSDASVLVTIRATDIGGNYSDRQFSIPNIGPVWQGSQTLTLYSDTNSIQLSAIDDSGVNPLYSVIAGSLPSGISLSQTGLLSGGSNEAEAAEKTFTVRATDNSGNFSDRQFTATTYLRLYNFTSHTFTTAGATGREGPTLSQVRTAYSTTWDDTYINMSNQGFQKWTVPTAGSYRIVAAGASSPPVANDTGRLSGKGTVIEVTTQLTGGQEILIAVGQKGTQASGSYEVGGAGATAVIINPGTGLITDITNNELLVVAGGGGGASYQYSPGGDASYSFTTDGSGTTSAGQGGTVYPSASYSGSPGGGIFSNGQNFNNNDGMAYGGLALINGFNGGYGPSSPAGNGGFGGGGYARGNSYAGGGGGGGYSGGRGGSGNGTQAYGGGSYVNTTRCVAISNSLTSTNVDGYVTITKL